MMPKLTVFFVVWRLPALAFLLLVFMVFIVFMFFMVFMVLKYESGLGKSSLAAFIFLVAVVLYRIFLN